MSRPFPSDSPLAAANATAEAALHAGLYTGAYLEDVNSVLQGPYITPMGAYCMGVVEALVRNTLQRMPPRHLLLVAADCSTVVEAIAVAEKWIGEEIAGGR